LTTKKADKGHLAKEHDGKWFAVRCPIETRGEGGYFLCAPSFKYELLQGRFEALPVLTAAERDVLLGAARGLNKWNPIEKVAPKPAPAAFVARLRAAGDISPLDDWSARGDVRSLLETHGYTFIKRDGTHDYFWRPGKREGGQSGSFWRESKVYKNFSSEDPYFQRHDPGDKAYSPGEIYAQLKCKGDLSAAAKMLLAEGYGTRNRAACRVIGADGSACGIDRGGDETCSER